MNPQTIFVAVLAVTVLNGFVSPILPLIFILSPVWMPEFAPKSSEAILYGASLIVSVATLIISGVPAALFERITGRQGSDAASMLIWLAVALLITAPGLI